MRIGKQLLSSILVFAGTIATTCSSLGCVAEVHDREVEVVTFMSYNTAHSRESSLEEVADVVESQNPDFVALQETTYEEAEYIAEKAGLHANKGTASKALLSPYPLDHSSHDLKKSQWPRTLDVYYGDCFTLANAHLAIGPEGEGARAQQVDQIVDILGKESFLLGDLNARPQWESIRKLRDAGLNDVTGTDDTFALGTEFSGKIDYIFADNVIDHETWTLKTDKSDHRPVVTVAFLEGGCE